MRKLVQLCTLLVLSSPAFAALTTIADVLHRADGSTCSGSLFVTWSTFTSVSNQLIFAGSIQSQVINGVVNVSLEPGTYRVGYNVGPVACTPTNETWVVPVSSVPLKIADVRNLNPPPTGTSIALTFLASGGAVSGQCLLFSGTVWGPGACGPWTVSGNDIFNSNTGNVGIGGAPSGNYRLEVTTAGTVGYSALGQNASVNNAAGTAAVFFRNTTFPLFSFYVDTTAASGELLHLGTYDGIQQPPAGATGDLLTFDRLNNKINFPNTNGSVNWNSDTGLARNAAGVVEINNGTAGTIRDLKDRHTFCGGTAPTITTHFNSSGDSMAGGDDCGAVTVGSGAATNTGVITFGTAYATAPVCLAENQTTLSQGVQAVSTMTTLTLHGFLFSSGAAQDFTNGAILKYHCKTY